MGTSSAAAATRRPPKQPAERRRCPICRPERPDRHARLAFLVAWIAANGDFDQEAVVMAGCDVLYHAPPAPALVTAGGPARPVGAVWTDPEPGVAVRLRRAPPPAHRPVGRSAWPTASAGPGTAWPSAPPPTPKEAPRARARHQRPPDARPRDAGQLDVDARQHPELGDTFYVTVDSERCRIALSGPAEPLVAVVERLRPSWPPTRPPPPHGLNEPERAERDLASLTRP